MHADLERLNDLSGRMIDGTFTVLNTLGAGFLVELKTVRALDDAHRMQCTNYL
jgi:hypothetical protein